MRMNEKIYSEDALSLAKTLLGKVLVRKVDGKLLRGKIVETEAYVGAIDKACHAYPNKVTERIKPLYEKGGISYVYFIYGKYFCFNVIAGEKGSAEGVLIRALEPLNDLEYLFEKRFNKSIHGAKDKEVYNISNGPSKLCLAYSITKEENYLDLINSDELYIEDGDGSPFEIIEAKRIGIDYAEEARDFLWRFYINESKYISKR